MGYSNPPVYDLFINLGAGSQTTPELEIAYDTNVASQDRENSMITASQSPHTSPISASAAASPFDITHTILGTPMELYSVAEADPGPTQLNRGDAPNEILTEVDMNDIVAGLRTWVDSFEMKSEEMARELAIQRSHFSNAFASLVEQQAKDQISVDSFYDGLRDIMGIVDGRKRI